MEEKGETVLKHRGQMGGILIHCRFFFFNVGDNVEATGVFGGKKDIRIA